MLRKGAAYRHVRVCYWQDRYTCDNSSYRTSLPLPRSLPNRSYAACAPELPATVVPRVYVLGRHAAPRRAARVNPHVQIRGEFVSPSVPCIVATSARLASTARRRHARIATIALARIDLNFFIYVRTHIRTSLSPNQAFKEKHTDYKALEHGNRRRWRNLPTLIPTLFGKIIDTIETRNLFCLRAILHGIKLTCGIFMKFFGEKKKSIQREICTQFCINRINSRRIVGGRLFFPGQKERY